MLWQSYLDAIRALAEVGPVARAALPAIRAALTHEKEETRAMAVSALARIGGAAEIAPLVKDSDLIVRMVAEREFARIRPTTRSSGTGAD